MFSSYVVISVLNAKTRVGYLLEAQAGLFLILFIITVQMHTLSVSDTVYSSGVLLLGMHLKQKLPNKNWERDTKVLNKLSKFHQQNDRHSLNRNKSQTIHILCLTLIQETPSVKKQIKENICTGIISFRQRKQIWL